MYVLTYHWENANLRQNIKLKEIAMSPPRYPAIGRRSFANKPVFRVMAQVGGPGAPWTTVLTTADRQYAIQRLEQFREQALRPACRSPRIMTDRTVPPNPEPKRGSRK